MKAALAIYDMDRTITRRPTYGAFMWRAVTRLAPWRIVLAPLVIGTIGAYLVGLVDRGRLKELNFRLLVGKVAPARLEKVVQDFAAPQIATNIMDGARARLAEDKAAGRRLVLATASWRLYAAAIAQRLGFDDVIATDVQYDDKGRTVARVDGVNCYGLGKLDMIEAWLQQQGLERDTVHIRFYSDHISDSPVHHWSDEAFATNAHARLIRLARDEGWEVLDWRDRK
jgi:HAD superfamily phosphoserine phosphatase-like hydrolase